jgi:hypothetical protein
MPLSEAPPIPLNVLEYLEKTFPDRAGSTSDSDAKLRERAARAEVVRHVRMVFEDQHKNFTI